MQDESLIARRVLAEQVEERLLQEILGGNYPPDSRIVETRVARQYGVSQAPVREALRSLESLGVVEILPFRGARVRRPSLSELLEAFDVRTELECLAARLAIPRITADDIAELERLEGDVEKAATSGDRRETARHDAALHTALLRVAGSRTLERTWSAVEPFSRTYITLATAVEGPEWTNVLHQAILHGLEARDAQATQAAIRRHFEEAAARLKAGWSATAGV